ncbi:putative glycosylphosphatidylinositol anchor attachment 1 protein-like [Apostichopus japonicus]|uniref:Putative glycosylphosphatidylinositol anchor attachment 1 protein-like n=1 Tax=Stichopus japonicus TaxID=307972 RepID=A0A2G8L0E1_STIJA|nr:putative glycosylphosphatidylinositol anchor attachment 1 protein-like [Apostichopus japonicus]
MGLMTNPKAQKIIEKVVLSTYKPLSVLLYIGTFVAIVIVSSSLFSAKTYISENALLPGLVERQYKSTSDINGYANYLEGISKTDDDIPMAWLQQTFEEIGLDTYSQNFSASHPFLNSPEDVRGTNVFAILRAPRIAGTEAVVFSIPYRGKALEKEMGSTNHGIALMMSLAKHFIQQSYLSKDIIFLIVDKENIGAQAWVEAYYDTSSDFLAKSPLHGRSGTIMAAINLELPGRRIDHFDLRLEGLNGQLPNLDLFNVAVKLCEKEGVKATFHGQGSLTHNELRDNYGIRYTSKTMLSNMLRQASGKPHGIHGLFLRYGIPALTLHGIPSNSKKEIKATASAISWKEYFAASTTYSNDFTSLFSSMFYLKQRRRKSKDIDKDEPIGEEPKGQHHYVIPVLIGVHVCGLLLYLSPEFFVVNFSSYFGLPPTEALVTGLGAVFTGVTLLQITSKRHNSDLNTDEDVKRKWMLLKCYALVWQAISLLALSMINFSFAFLVGVFTIPVFVLCRPYRNFMSSGLYKLLLLLVSPPAILFLLIAVHNHVFHGQSISLDLFMSAGNTALNSIPQAVIDQYLLNDWTFAVVCLVLFPSWQMFWICSAVK